MARLLSKRPDPDPAGRRRSLAQALTEYRFVAALAAKMPFKVSLSISCSRSRFLAPHSCTHAQLLSDAALSHTLRRNALSRTHARSPPDADSRVPLVAALAAKNSPCLSRSPALAYTPTHTPGHIHTYPSPPCPGHGVWRCEACVCVLARVCFCVCCACTCVCARA